MGATQRLLSFGHNTVRSWDDARKYGFISAGGGAWYSKTLFQLKPGDRVWVNIPGKGYVGVGRVLDEAVRLRDFLVSAPSGRAPFMDLPKQGTYREDGDESEETDEYFVAVEWESDVPLDNAVSEVGFFGNQNSVARPTAAKWVHTVNRLKHVWGITD